MHASADARAVRSASRVGGGRGARPVRARPQPRCSTRTASSSTCATSPARRARPTATSSRPLAGRIALLRLTVNIIRVAWGWPMFVVSLAGHRARAADAARIGAWRSGWRCPVVSYYVGFIDVVLYNYDRFMLPVCLVLSLFGGLASTAGLRPAGAEGVAARGRRAAVFAYTMLYAATVDLAMLRDSRYTVEQWLRPHVDRRRRRRLTSFREQYYPRLEPFNSDQIASVARAAGAAAVVLRAECRLRPSRASRTREIGQLIAGLQSGRLGYRLVFRYRHPSPWPWLPGQPREISWGTGQNARLPRCSATSTPGTRFSRRAAKALRLLRRPSCTSRY